MTKWDVTGIIHAGKYLGQVEADTKEEAIAKGLNLEECGVYLCHHCADECEDPEIHEVIVARIDLVESSPDKEGQS